MNLEWVYHPRGGFLDRRPGHRPNNYTVDALPWEAIFRSNIWSGEAHFRPVDLLFFGNFRVFLATHRDAYLFPKIRYFWMPPPHTLTQINPPNWKTLSPWEDSLSSSFDH